MIVVLSTSSPLASVALFDLSGQLLGEGETLAPRAASGAVVRLLDSLLAELRTDRTGIQKVVADIGPGSFTGVKVSVTLAQSVAFALGVPAAGVPAFDLVSTDRVVAIGGKPGHWFVREPGLAGTCRSGGFPEDAVGYGPGVANPVYPSARTAAPLLADLEDCDPAALRPLYIAEPDISPPKTPFRHVASPSPRFAGGR